MEACTHLVGEGKVGELACKLTRESIFGEGLMAKCTVQGKRGKVLPPEGIAVLNEMIIQH